MFQNSKISKILNDVISKKLNSIKKSISSTHTNHTHPCTFTHIYTHPHTHSNAHKDNTNSIKFKWQTSLKLLLLGWKLFKFREIGSHLHFVLLNRDMSFKNFMLF